MKAVCRLGLMLALMTTPVLAQSSGARQKEEARALEQQGKIAEAETAWRAYMKAHPSDPEPYGQLGLLEARQEHYQEAIPLYRKALAMDPNVAGLRLNLGLALFKDGQLKEAIPEFAILLNKAPAGSAEAERLEILLGMAYYGLAQYAEAVPYLEQATAHDATNLPLRLALAHSCLWSKQMKCVMDVYHEILSLNAESAEADMLAGEALDEMQDTEGAIKMFRAAIAANPKEPNVHFGLGYLLWAQKQYAEAVVQFNAELENDPNHAQSLVYLGDSYIQLNKSTEARDPLEKAVALDPGLWLGYLDLGILDSDAGRNERALQELRKAAKAKPDEVNVHWRLARLLRTMGKTEEAKAEFDAAKKLNKAADEELYKKIANGKQRRGTEESQKSAAPAQ